MAELLTRDVTISPGVTIWSFMKSEQYTQSSSFQ